MNRTLKAYKKWAETYDSHPNPHTLVEHTDFIKLTNPRKNEFILDAACGTGKYTKEFHKAGAKVIGLDFCNKMLEIAKEKIPKAEFILHDISKKFPFKASYFDKVTCGQTLKHIRNLKPVFSEFYRILKKGGKLIFSVTHPEINFEGFAMRYRPKFNLAELSEIYHHKFTDYFDAFDYSGFRIDKIKQVPVSNSIKHLLTEKSYRILKGRYEVIIFRLIKPAASKIQKK